MVNSIVEQEYIKISKGVTAYTVAVVVYSVVKWEWSIPKGNINLFFKSNQNDNP